jgi:small-conductance mechanosensitive channel
LFRYSKVKEILFDMQTVFDNLVTIFQNWWQNFMEHLPQIIIGVLILLISIYLARLLSTLVKKALENRPKSDPETIVLLGRLTNWSMIILGIILAFQQAGIEISAFLTGLGIIGFTVGFALQDVSKNFIAGILLLMQQPFDIGDAIEVSNHSGAVIEINLRDTVLKTWDGLIVSIPNGDVFTSPITNYSRANPRRITLDVGVSYESDLKEVQKIALETLSTLPEILEDPTPIVSIHSFGDTTINLSMYYWLDTQKTGYLDAQTAGITAIKEAFEKNNIELPFPTQTIFLNN